MTPSIFSLHSPDAPDLASIEGSSHTQVLLEAEIGVEGEPGADLFSLIVATPSWLQDRVAKEEGVLLEHTLLVSTFQLEVVRRLLGGVMNQCEGKDWEEVAKKLSRHFYWEFEDDNPGSS